MKRKLLSLIPSFIGISLMAQVGINTDPDPSAMLKVQGNMAITTLNRVPVQEADPLVWDANTGEVMTGKINGKLMYFLDYSILCHNTNNVYSFENGIINDFDTKIDANRYKIMISNIYPVNNNGGVVDIRHVASSDGHDWTDNDVVPQIMRWYEGAPSWEYESGDYTKFQPYLNPILKADPKEKDGTWHLQVGYLNARPDGSYGSNPNIFRWNIRIIAIDKSLLNAYSIQKTISSEIGENDDNPINDQHKN